MAISVERAVSEQLVSMHAAENLRKHLQIKETTKSILVRSIVLKGEIRGNRIKGKEQRVKEIGNSKM